MYKEQEYRRIWKEKNGEIPKGYVIHHIDKNRKNNDISNLQLLSKSEHTKIHKKIKSRNKSILRIWFCFKCNEEFHYANDKIKKVFCKCGNEMQIR